MGKRCLKSEGHKVYSNDSKNEKEIYCVDFEQNSKPEPFNSIQIPLTKSSTPQDTVELSLEVEITDSLRQLIASPETHNSELLDVTIVRPSDLESMRNTGTEIETITASKSSEVRKLIANVESERLKKKRLIEEYMEKVKLSEILESSSSSGRNKCDYNTANVLHRHRTRHNADQKHINRRNIAVMSAPAKATLSSDAKSDRGRNHKYIKDFNIEKERNLDTKISSIRILKPLVGEIKESLKNLEFKIADYGDHRCHPKQKYSLSTSTTDSYDVKRSRRHNYPNTHQVYTTTNNFDKIRNLLVCQNKDNTDDTEDKPCMCQHCGMVGLLIDSQKRPIINHPLQNQNDARTKENKNKLDQQNSARYHHKQSNPHNKTRSDENTYRIIQDLYYRLQTLENRVTVQEQRAVPKSYFRYIMNKILNQQDEVFHSQPERTRLRDHGTQYNSKNFEHLFSSKRKDQSKLKYKQSKEKFYCNKRTYCVNPVLIQTDSVEPSSEGGASSKQGDKTGTSGISDFLRKFGSEAQGGDNKKDVETNTKSSTMQNFWKWGEEMIKPGIDLKTKIMSLVEEQFQTFKGSKSEDTKTDSTKSPESKKSRHEAASASNLAENPTPYEDIGVQNPKGNEYSSSTVRKMLDSMSENIYNDHLKPVINARKQEQKHYSSKENTKQIKASSDGSASKKLNCKQTQITKEILKCKPKKEINKDFLKPLKVPSFIRNAKPAASAKTSKSSRKSGIPLRILSPLRDDCTKCSQLPSAETGRSLKPRLQSPRKSVQDDGKSFSTNNSMKIQQNLGITSNKKYSGRTKPIQVKYINPKAKRWNEESSVSFHDECDEKEQVLLKDKRSESSHNTKIRSSNSSVGKRKISENLSEKVKILSKYADTEIDKAELWNYIWNQAKNHYKSEQDTVVIQIPTKHIHNDGNDHTEIEFTIADIQKLVNTSNSSNSTTEKIGDPNDTGESFLLIRSRKILDEVHKRLVDKS